MSFAAVRIVSLTVAAATLTACSGGRGPDYALSCTFEVNPPGQYEYPAGVVAPVVTPGIGGTAEGAASMNACIQRMASTSGYAGSNRGRATVETESVSGGNYTVSTYTYGSPPAAAAGPRGKLPLPTQYPLMPGDTQLWAQLSEAQQLRAIQFLQGGSTIRSSLSGDN
ncbi:hypothetical protein [Parasedimentitalea maritima]|uniref:Lipoprotein n=1 Tax=Parasedimentitalea maritima TaxID=2578117 RepID=A0A6A4RF58_9RHOB|nr:hypothetical protein [Zongyanglinia marina]KAE9632696.1 hypothetical protein GP644_02680 [Zongyanglinia marina]